MERVRRQGMCHVQAPEVIEEGLEASSPVPTDPTDSRPDPESLGDLSDLPWHHAQLVMLYGREVAEDIIHPKMERKQVAIDPNLKNESHIGAAQLWSMLRNESKDRLLLEDRKIPDGLKESYGAFVRQLVLQKGEVPVQRNFYEKEDVPDMDHLLDRRKLLRTLEIRHKIELMDRSSKINQDKASILLYNNPPPDLVNASGEEGIDRYLPSWLEQDDESVASYRKWLEDGRPSPSTLEPSDSLIELVRPRTRDTSRHQGPPKVTFLTELEAGAERGRFSDKYKKEKGQEQTINNPEESVPAMATAPVELKPFRGDNVRSRQDAKKQEKADPTWQPLTLNALVEYSDKRNVVGSGSFRNGSMRMFPVSNEESPSY